MDEETSKLHQTLQDYARACARFREASKKLEEAKYNLERHDSLLCEAARNYALTIYDPSKLKEVEHDG
jgi:hypothetical protein